jgi:nucleotide-binding universal stress UspA family protein
MFETILLALDNSEHAKEALETTKSLAKLSGGQVRVLHVREFGFAGRAGQVDLEDKTEAHQIVDQAVADLKAVGVEATGIVRGALHGHAAGEILDEAASAGATTIVMGSRGRSELKGLVMGSTTHKVLHLGTFPVLVVR